MTTAPALKYSSLNLPPSANPAYFNDFGKQVEGFDMGTATEEQLKEVMDMLYKVGAFSTTCEPFSLIPVL
jgi:hypothetical protein